ncbi:helix-turn-helix domain-containing protein [Carnobacterium maltaromaticum]|uniref:helix-turn-helix domain-containing protein n=1 Tax=Carnobacterium maltaromaticum TaxID=2751 RepID=UPI0039BE4E90
MGPIIPYEKILFDKKEYRKINLVKRLEAASLLGLTRQQLFVGYSHCMKTLTADIKELRQDVVHVYGEGLIPESSDGKLLIENNLGFTKQSLQLFYVKKSRQFWIINELFHYKQNERGKLEQSSYYSMSAIYKGLKSLNKSFELLGVTFSSRGIEGDERKIRYILFEIYWSLFGGIEWPFRMDQSILVAEMDGLEKRGVLLNTIEKEKLMFWLAIISQRVTNDYSASRINKIKIGQLLGVFFRSSDRAVTLNSMPEKEFNFFKEVLHYYFRKIYPFPFEIKQNSQLNYLLVEKELNQIGKEIGWNESQCAELRFRLRAVTYYANEGLLDWYCFREAIYDINFDRVYQLVNHKLKKRLKLIPIKLRNAYLLECKKMGHRLNDPVRISILTKEENYVQLRTMFKKYSQYELIIYSDTNYEVDVVLTDYQKKYQKEQLKGNPYLLFEQPLTENKIVTMLDEIMNMRIENKKNGHI